MKEETNSMNILDLWLGIRKIISGDVPTNFAQPEQDLDIILFLIVSLKEGILEKVNFDLPRDKVWDQLHEIVHGAKPIAELNNLEIALDGLRSSIHNTDPEEIIDLTNYLIEFKSNIEEWGYKEVVEYVIHHCTDVQNSVNEYVLPAKLSAFIMRLALDGKKSNVYNPFTGYGSFGVNLHESSSFYGQEINKENQSIAILRLMASGLQNIWIEHDDAISYWNPNNEKFSLVIASPPLNLKIQNESPYKYADDFVILQSLDALDAEGKVVLLTSLKFLYRGDSQSKLLRQVLTTDGQLEMVLELPGSILDNTSIPLALVIIRKKTNKRNMTLFADANDYILEGKVLDRVLLDYDKLYENLVSAKAKKKFIFSSTEEIRSNDYNLSPKRYYLDYTKGVPLKELVSILDTTRNTHTLKGRLLRIRDLLDNSLRVTLDSSTIPEDNISDSMRLLTKSCLLVSSRFSKLKPTYLENKDDQVFFRPEIVPLAVNSEMVDIEFLVHELSSEYVQEQVEALSLGSTIPGLRRDDLLRVRIMMPNAHNLGNYDQSLREQRAKVQGIKESHVRQKQKEVEQLEAKYDVESSYLTEVGTLKHLLNRPILEISSATENILNYLKNNDGRTVSLKDKLSEKIDVTLEQSLKTILSTIDDADKILKSSQERIKIDDLELSHLNLTSTLEDCEEEISSRNYQFQTKLQFSNDVKEIPHLDLVIESNENILHHVFNNIADNASRHAFNENKKENLLLINVELDKLGTKPEVVVQFKNNGFPFPENFDHDKFISKFQKAGRTGNTGLGGWEIKKYLKIAGGSFKLILNEDERFPTIYEMRFPLLNDEIDLDELFGEV